MQFPATLVHLAETPPPPPQPPVARVKIFWTGSIHFMKFPATLVQLAETPHLPH